MKTTDDLGLRLEDWMIAATTTTAPTEPVSRALDVIQNVPQRPSLLVRTGLRPAVLAKPSDWTPMRLAIVALLAIALLSSAAWIGSRLADPREPNATLPIVPVSIAPSPTISPRQGIVPFVVGPRSAPALARLSDGRVLVAGGVTVDGAPLTLATAELVDLASGRSTLTGSLQVAREDANAVTLADGRVVVAGGFQDRADQPTLASAEIYDPATGAFRLVEGRWTDRGTCHCGVRFRVLVHMRMTLLPSGELFVAGGQALDGYVKFAEVFNPLTATTRKVDLGCDASRGTQTLLHDGRVLVICYDSSGAQDANRARIYDPATETVSSPAQPLTGSAGAATLLSDGRVLLTGSAASQLSPAAELYDPVANAWAKVPGTVNPSGFAVVAPLSNGRVSFTAYGDGSSWIYDPATNSFTAGSITPADLVIEPLDLGDGRITMPGPGNASLMTVQKGSGR